jgi:DNA polymerase III subunit chi
MTDIAFHFNAPERLGYALRLLRKAYGTGARVAVTGDEPLLAELDRALWTMAPLAFIPHTTEEQNAMVVQLSPIVLAQNLSALPHYEVLVNLSDEVPQGFERFERLIEVVTTDEQQRRTARQRWRHYSERGYALTRHDLAAAA